MNDQIEVRIGVTPLGFSTPVLLLLHRPSLIDVARTTAYLKNACYKQLAPAERDPHGPGRERIALAQGEAGEAASQIPNADDEYGLRQNTGGRKHAETDGSALAAADRMA